MTPEQKMEQLNFEALRVFEKHMDAIRKRGGLFPEIKYPDMQPDESCPDCGGSMVAGNSVCPNISFDDFGPVKVKCQECQGGKGHPAFRCRVCARIYSADEVAKQKIHFFMNKKKIIHA